MYKKDGIIQFALLLIALYVRTSTYFHLITSLNEVRKFEIMILFRTLICGLFLFGYNYTKKCLKEFDLVTFLKSLNFYPINTFLTTLILGCFKNQLFLPENCNYFQIIVFSYSTAKYLEDCFGNIFTPQTKTCSKMQFITEYIF